MTNTASSSGRADPAGNDPGMQPDNHTFEITVIDPWGEDCRLLTRLSRPTGMRVPWEHWQGVLEDLLNHQQGWSRLKDTELPGSQMPRLKRTVDVREGGREYQGQLLTAICIGWTEQPPDLVGAPPHYEGQGYLVFHSGDPGLTGHIHEGLTMGQVRVLISRLDG